LGVSLDGADEVANDAVRGQGSFRQIVGALKRCQEASISTSLYVTLNAVNVNQLDAFIELAKENGCKNIHFNEVNIAGRALHLSDELALSSEQKECLEESVARAISEGFGERVTDTDERCWVDGESLYMTADGNLFVCSEVSQRRPDLAIGNIRTFSLKMWLERESPRRTQQGDECCYGVYTSEHAVLTKNIGSDCTFAPRRQRIETMAQFNAAFDELYQGMESDCKMCQYPDCMGYVWLLKKEAECMFEQGVPLVQINNGPTFIHSFPTKLQGQLDLSVRYPPCSQLCKDERRCGIHTNRPLVCHMYPIGLETESDGTTVWALHRDCQYVQRVEERGLLATFEQKARRILNNLSSELLEEIVGTYRSVHAITSFPNGENNFSTLKEVYDVKM
jgi:Fe-S-cluster containining protein